MMVKKKTGQPQMSASLFSFRVLAHALLLGVLAAAAGCGSLNPLAGRGRQLVLPVRTGIAQAPGHCLPVPLLYAEGSARQPTEGVSLELRQAYRRHWQIRLRQLKLRLSPECGPEQVAAAAAVSATRLQEDDYQSSAVLLYQALALSGLTAAERDELEYLAVLHRQAHLLFRALVAVQRLREGSESAEGVGRRVREYLQLQQRQDDFLGWHDPFWREFLQQAVVVPQNQGAGGQ